MKKTNVLSQVFEDKEFKFEVQSENGKVIEVYLWKEQKILQAWSSMNEFNEYFDFLAEAYREYYNEKT